MIKMWQKSQLFLQFQFFSIFRVQHYTRTTVITNNIDDQRARAPLIHFLQLLQMYNPAEIKGSFPKIATSGPHLTFLWT